MVVLTLSKLVLCRFWYLAGRPADSAAGPTGPHGAGWIMAACPTGVNVLAFYMGRRITAIISLQWFSVHSAISH